MLAVRGVHLEQELTFDVPVGVRGVHLEQELDHGVMLLARQLNLLGVFLSEVRSEHGSKHWRVNGKNRFMNKQFFSLHHQHHVGFTARTGERVF